MWILNDGVTSIQEVGESVLAVFDVASKPGSQHYHIETCHK